MMPTVRMDQTTLVPKTWKGCWISMRRETRSMARPNLRAKATLLVSSLANSSASRAILVGDVLCLLLDLTNPGSTAFGDRVMSTILQVLLLAFIGSLRN